MCAYCTYVLFNIRILYIYYILSIYRWGILHTEKFWRENAKLVEQDSFKALRALIALLTSRDPVSTSILMCVYVCVYAYNLKYI